MLLNIQIWLWWQWSAETSTPLEFAHDCGASCQYIGTLRPPKQRKLGAYRLSLGRILGSHRGNRAGPSDEWESKVAVNRVARIHKKLFKYSENKWVPQLGVNRPTFVAFCGID